MTAPPTERSPLRLLSLRLKDLNNQVHVYGLIFDMSTFSHLPDLGYPFFLTLRLLFNLHFSKTILLFICSQEALFNVSIGIPVLRDLLITLK
jgi:hypothetical protein